MYSPKRGADLLKSVLTAVGASLMTAVILMLFIPSYLDRIRPEPINDPLSVPQAQRMAQDNEVTPMSLPENAERLDITTIASKVIPSVVGISTTRVDTTNLFRSTEEQVWSVGSGVIVSENGYILTNHHVIGGNANKIIVTLDNGKTVDATSQWSDPTLDLAIIKISAKGLRPAPLGDTNELKVGERAVAIGNPLGLQFQRTVTAGIVSAVNRTISVMTDGKENYMEGLIQTDASINPGNSGGPLINANGEVIGINTIKVASAEGMGFAIPINICKPVISSFQKNGSYTTPYMGLFAYDKGVAEYVKQDFTMSKGVYVAEIDPESPVYQAGIRIGDIITHMGEVEVNTMMQLREEMFICGSKSDCTITFIRDGKVRKVDFTLGERTRDGVVTR